uniref:Baseplate hub n=1 Tax=Salmonella phage vB_SEnST11_KE22 TaxID=3161173 RepID=A0AAU8GED5_9CAUD
MPTYRTRTFRLTIGKPVYIGQKPTNISDYTNQDTKNAYVVSNETGDANIEFEVKKDNSKDPNKGYVTLYNLSDETVSYLDANQRESIAIVLEAGFDGENQMIFSGTVEFVQDKWDGHTRQTKMILGDATTNIMTAKTARSYKKGTPLDTVLNDLISDLKLPIGKVVKFGGQTLQQSMAFTGNAANNLERLAKNTGSTFSVQDGAVYWTTQGKRFKTAVYEISAESGMHDSPTPQNPEPAKRRLEKKSKSKKKPKTNKGPSRAEIKEDAGLVVVTELNGAIIPESTIYLKSQKYTGFYKVVYLTHKGQLEGGDWVSEIGLAETRGGVVEE